MKRTATIWAGRFLWGTLMLMIAVGAISLQLDFVTRTRPALAAYAPEMFWALTYTSLTAAVFDANRSVLGFRLATQILKRPILAERATVHF